MARWTWLRALLGPKQTTEPVVVPAVAAPKAGGPAPWRVFVDGHPRFSDANELSHPWVNELPVVQLENHPLFSEWRQELERSPARAVLDVPSHQRDTSWQPTADASFARGPVAFLEEPSWPRCGACQRELEFCLQLSTAAMSGWLPGGSLVVMFCFACREPAAHASFVRSVKPLFRVERRDDSSSREWSGGPPPDPVGVPVSVRPPRRSLPTAHWLRTRSGVHSDSASSALLGYEPLPLTDLFPTRVDEDLYAAWEEWASAGDDGSSDFLGGLPNWDQDDATPRCSHGEMLHLLDYSGDQFSDGALHVFVCRARSCTDLGVVAEF